MFKSGFETPQSQSQLIASASPRVLIFSALGRRGVGSIRLAWGAFAATSGDMETAAHSFRGSSSRSLPWTMWLGLPGESRQEGRVCQRGKAAVGAENDLDAEKRPAWGPVLSTETLGPPWPTAAGLALCSAPAILGRNLQGAGGSSAPRFPLMD